MSFSINPPFFFSVNHIINPIKTKLIYGIRYNDLDYFIFKTFGIRDCQQADINSKLDPEVFETISNVITEIEQGYKKIPPIEFINIDVFNILGREKNAVLYESGK
jgi:hypothetical protein